MTDTKGQLILVVDSDDSLRALFRDLFTLEGYAVDVVTALEQERLHKIAPSAVVYGLGFGDEADHIAVLRGLLEHRPEGCTTIVCTADPAQIVANYADLTALGIPIVSKPFDIDVLLGHISDGLSGAVVQDGRRDGPTPS